MTRFSSEVFNLKMILTRRANKSREVVQLSHKVVVNLRKMEEEKEKEKDNRGDALDSEES